MVARHIDLVLQQGFNACFFPTGNRDRLAFPKHTVVNQKHIYPLLYGKIDCSFAGGNRSSDFGNFFFAFDLQTIGRIVLKQPYLQCLIAPSQNFAA